MSLIDRGLVLFGTKVFGYSVFGFQGNNLVRLAQWLSWLERRPVTAEVDGSSPFRVALFQVWDLSSAGRASALQAGGHRFEPCSLHFFYQSSLIIYMGDFPSGQREQTVNLLALPSVVRIHDRPVGL